jgi:hypothetical protein
LATKCLRRFIGAPSANRSFPAGAADMKSSRPR